MESDIIKIKTKKKKEYGHHKMITNKIWKPKLKFVCPRRLNAIFELIRET